MTLEDKITYLRNNVFLHASVESQNYMNDVFSYVENINIPKKPVIKNWSPSKCPTCEHSFADYEPCDDGYYDRAEYLERCPYCGQKLKWYN